MNRPAIYGVSIVLACLGLSQIAAAGYIHAKAIVAQHLIASAWAQQKQGGVARRPWPGADMRPVARLSVPRQGVELYVLDTSSARALAFGPAHVSGTALPGSWGNTVIVAHRDTHFAFLEKLAAGEEIDIETSRGAARYRVDEITVVDRNETRVLDPADSAQLTLITCYPFDAVRPGTTLRYVVIASRVA